MFKRILKWTAVAFGLFVVYMLVQLFWPAGPIEVSPQTTVITEPLADDGLPDYSKHLLDQMREGVTPENNGAIPFLQAMWPAEIEPAHQAPVCAELRMKVPTSDGMKQPSSDSALLAEIALWLSENHPGEEQEYAREDLAEALALFAMESPWRAEEIPPLADWLDLHREHFDLLHEAANREKYYLPSPTLLVDPEASVYMILLPHQQTLRYAVRCLRVRANYFIGLGELATAWRDCRAMYLLSDTPKRETMISELVSMASEELSNQTALQILASENLSAELAAEMRNFLSKREMRRNMRGCINVFERLGYVTTVLELAGRRHPQNTFLTDMDPLPAIAENVAINWNEVLERGNSWYDLIDQALEEPTPILRSEAWEKICEKLEDVAPSRMAGAAFGRNTRSEAMADLLAALLLPAVNAGIVAEYRANDRILLSQIAADLAIHRIANGEYPAALADLPADRQDRLSDQFGQQVVYQRTDDGYLLYTIGENGQDDQGINNILDVYQGYPIAMTDEEDRVLRQRLGLPAYEPQFEGDYERLDAPYGADDISIRMPLIQDPLPTFESGE